MDVGDLRFLFGYDRWATEKVLAAAEGVGDDVWGATGVVGERGLGSILVHVLGAHQRWRASISNALELAEPEAEREFEDEPLPSLAALSEAWTAEFAAFDAFLDAMTDRLLALANDGVRVDSMLAHVANHGTQHRSEAAVLLTAAGRSPGDLDMIDYAHSVAVRA